MSCDASGIASVITAMTALVAAIAGVIAAVRGAQTRSTLEGVQQRVNEVHDATTISGPLPSPHYPPEEVSDAR